jgi:hypothetical protein
MKNNAESPSEPPTREDIRRLEALIIEERVNWERLIKRFDTILDIEKIARQKQIELIESNLAHVKAQLVANGIAYQERDYPRDHNAIFSGCSICGIDGIMHALECGHAIYCESCIRYLREEIEPYAKLLCEEKIKSFRESLRKDENKLQEKEAKIRKECFRSEASKLCARCRIGDMESKKVIANTNC